MLTTRLDRLGDIEANIREDVLGNLAVGVNPAKATIYLQSQVPETSELFMYFAMLVSVARAQRIPTLKDKLREMRIEAPSYGLLGYPILQAEPELLVRLNSEGLPSVGVRSGRPQEVSLAEPDAELADDLEFLSGLDTLRDEFASGFRGEVDEA